MNEKEDIDLVAEGFVCRNCAYFSKQPNPSRGGDSCFAYPGKRYIVQPERLGCAKFYSRRKKKLEMERAKLAGNLGMEE